jgi:hypothetical protein
LSWATVEHAAEKLNSAHRHEPRKFGEHQHPDHHDTHTHTHTHTHTMHAS